MENLLYNISQVLGITIIHSLWQGLLIYLVLRLLFLVMPDLTAVKKYKLSALALLSMVIWFVCTFWVEALAYNWHPLTAVNTVRLAGDLKFQTHANILIPVHEYNLQVNQQSIDHYKTSFYDIIKSYLPYISFLYAAGLIFNLGRLGLAWNKIRVIKQNMMADEAMQRLISRFSNRLNIRRYIQVNFSGLVDVPCVIGYLKPVLLLPVTITTQLSADEIEAILLHELSHIKGNDYLVNVIQQIISVLLFFNPFAQLVSRGISAERENRCDDMVVEITGNPLIYAHALLKLEETRQFDLKLALAATGKKYHLLTRIERMMMVKKPIGSIRHILLAIALFTGGLIICFSFKASSPTAFTFSGKINGVNNANIMLSYIDDNGKAVKDSCRLQNGTFNFKGDISSPRMMYLSLYKGSFKIIGDDDVNTTSFFIEPGNIMATGNYGYLKGLKISGSKTQEEYLAYQSQFAALGKITGPIEAKYLSVSKEYIIAKKQHKGDKALDSLNKITTAIRRQQSAFSEKYTEIENRYINTHPNSYITAFKMNFYSTFWPVDDVKKIYNKLSPEIQNSPYGKDIERAIVAKDSNSPGKTATNFATVDVNGKRISLSDFKGRYVLLDFWISSEPRLDDAPHLMQLYKKYNKAGLDIIAVADDDNDPDFWKHTIQKNGTAVWHHVLRGLKESKAGLDRSNSIDDKFDVHVAPTKILIDKDGKIAGRYVGTEGTAALDKELAAVFN